MSDKAIEAAFLDMMGEVARRTERAQLKRDLATIRAMIAACPNEAPE